MNDFLESTRVCRWSWTFLGMGVGLNKAVCRTGLREVVTGDFCLQSGEDSGLQLPGSPWTCPS